MKKNKADVSVKSPIGHLTPLVSKEGGGGG